jgi:hypothetical protein
MAARSTMSLDARLTIATHMLIPERPYGQASQLARRYQVSRQAVYYLSDKARQALATALTPRSGPTPTGPTLTVTSVRLERAVVTLSLLGVSERDSLIALDELLDTRRSVGYIAQVLRRAAQLAAARNLELTPPLSGLLAADEIFLHAQPMLGVIHPASLYLIDLRLTAQRDGETWGCELLDVAGATGITSDAGRGLAVGAQLAHLACHAGDWFHPLHAAAWVGAQYERRAYAALAEQYEREALVLRTQTAQRLENHWRKYEAACAVVDHAIERYDQWQQQYLHLRAQAAQFDWKTGQVCCSGLLQANLQALASQFERWAEGTQARALVSLLKHQAVALTAVLPHLQQALQPLQQAWGIEATQVVCRLWQALQDWAFPFWKPEQRHQLEQAITESLAWASQHLGERLITLQHLVSALLAQWPRTSSSIECLNSLLRPFLNGRKHVAQGFLDLFRFYHNTQPFVRGQRAGTSPLELAGGPRTDDPLAFLGLGAKS